jgi:hypothetical protein
MSFLLVPYASGNLKPELDCLIHVRLPNTHPNLQAIKKNNTSENPKVIPDFRIEIIRMSQMHRLI